MRTKVLFLFVIAIVICFTSFFLPKEVFAGGASLVNGNKTNEAISTQPTKYINEQYKPATLNQSQQSKSGGLNWQELLLGAFIGWILGFLSVWVVDK